MIPISANDVLQAVVEGSNERWNWSWVSHYKSVGVVSPSSHAQALGQYLQQFLTQLAVYLNDEWHANCVKISRVAPNPMGVYYYDTSFPVDGAVATDGIPNQSAAVVRFGSNEVGASNRGRMFLSGIPEASTDGGQLTPTPRADIQTAFFSYWLPGFSAAGDSGVPVIFSRQLYGTDPPGHPANVDDYTALVTDIAVQFNLGVIRNRRYPLNAAP